MICIPDSLGPRIIAFDVRHQQECRESPSNLVFWTVLEQSHADNKLGARSCSVRVYHFICGTTPGISFAYPGFGTPQSFFGSMLRSRLDQAWQYEQVFLTGIFKALELCEPLNCCTYCRAYTNALSLVDSKHPATGVLRFVQTTVPGLHVP